MKEKIDTPEPGYERLASVLISAYEQAATGKGAQRHAQGQPFHEQPMQMISRLLGSGDGMAFQAVKKIQEAQRLPRDQAITELLGAINYIAGMIIRLEDEHPDNVEFTGRITVSGEAKMPAGSSDIPISHPRPLY